LSLLAGIGGAGADIASAGFNISQAREPRVA
jgi:predicted small secreted protein